MAESHAEIIEDHQKQVDQLRRLFDLYFQGFERVPPTDKRDILKGRLRRLREEAARWNTADRFKINTLHQKFLTYDRMWERSLQQIEDGTHRREKIRRKQRREAEVEDAPSPAPAAAARRQPQDDGGGLDKAKVERIYNVYMQAKKRTGERSNLTVDALKKQLEKQVPAIKAKHGCKDVEFKVVLKNGKAMLKAIPK